MKNLNFFPTIFTFIFIYWHFSFLSFLRACSKISLTIWSPRFEVSARRDKGYVPMAHNRGATPQYFKDGTPRRARTLLGCDYVAHRLRSCATQYSLLLVSLQNHLWQMVNIIFRQALTRRINSPDKSGNYRSSNLDHYI